MGPLTDSLNRHAFYSLLEQSRTSEAPAGCVAVADIDNLKPITTRSATQPRPPRSGPGRWPSGLWSANDLVLC